MKKKSIYISMLILVGAFLIAMYVIKFWFPQEFVIVIENKRVVAIGNYIDCHSWLYYICCGITAFITYWLYLCATSHKLYLKWYECLFVILTIIIIRVVDIYEPTIATILSCSSFMFLPALCGGDIKTCGLVFTVHSLAQGLSLKIRNLPIYLTNINYATSVLMVFECYLWLLLFYIIFNIKGGKE